MRLPRTSAITSANGTSSFTSSSSTARAADQLSASRSVGTPMSSATPSRSLSRNVCNCDKVRSLTRPVPVVVRSTVSSCIRTSTRSRVRAISISMITGTCRNVFSNVDTAFSGNPERGPPRCAATIVRLLSRRQSKNADKFARASPCPTASFWLLATVPEQDAADSAHATKRSIVRGTTCNSYPAPAWGVPSHMKHLRRSAHHERQLYSARSTWPRRHGSRASRIFDAGATSAHDPVICAWGLRNPA